ncbi:MAG: Clp protease N-terminal domain-containing protein, partial [Actinomycetota bacterium]
MDLNKLTFKSQEALQAAQQLADARNHQQIAPEHLLHALLSEPEGVVFPTLQKLGASPRTLRDGTTTLLERMPKTYVERPAGGSGGRPPTAGGSGGRPPTGSQAGQVYVSPELAA